MPKSKLISVDQEILLEVASSAIRSWDIDCKNLVLYSQSENTVFQVEDKCSNFFALRIHRPGYHNLNSLRSEPDWLAFLKNEGINVPLPIRTINNNFYKGIKLDKLEITFQVDLVKWIKGISLENEFRKDSSKKNIERVYKTVGKIMAQMHTASVKFDPPKSFSRHSWDEEGLMGDSPFWGKFWEIDNISVSCRADLLKIKKNLYEILKSLPKGDNFSMIHADLHPRNVLTYRDSVSVIDFDDSGFGWHSFDLAVALWDVELFSEDQKKIAYQSIVGSYIELREDPRIIENIDLFLLIRSLMILGWTDARKELGLHARIPLVLESALDSAKKLSVL